jgi:hypothetical protein
MTVAIVGGLACGGHPPIPNRGVVETDLGSWHFRRFQGPVFDVEVWIEKNKGEAYSASYITEDAEKRGRVVDDDLVNVVVTRYQKPDGVVRETVRLARRLAAENGYQVDENKVGGARALTISGHGESWVMWPSTSHVVKVGGRGRKDVPPAMVSSYADRYPSDLPGGALEGPLPPGPDQGPSKAPVKDKYDPNNPQPDFEKYDPKKVNVKPSKPADVPPPDDSDTKPAKKSKAAPADDSTDDPPPDKKPAKKKKAKAKETKKPADDDE